MRGTQGAGGRPVVDKVVVVAERAAVVAPESPVVPEYQPGSRLRLQQLSRDRLTMAPRVAVMGGSGKAGEYICCELVRNFLPSLQRPVPPHPHTPTSLPQLARGYEVLNCDKEPPAARSRTYDDTATPAFRATAAEYKQVNVEDLGEVVSVTAGADAIVHMAAYPSPDPVTENIVFRTNIMNNWNVLEAAEINGIPKVVMASSINALGASFGDYLPVDYFPLDEEHRTRSQDACGSSTGLPQPSDRTA